MSYKRSIFLINPKFQLKFSLLVCVLLLIATSLYPIILNDQFVNFMHFVKKFSPQMKEAIANHQSKLMLILIVWQVCFFILSFVILIFFTHRIAGPLYKLKMWLNKLREEKRYTELSFRDGDYFNDIAQAYNETVSEIHENTLKDSVYINEVQDYLETLKKDLSQEKQETCTKIQERLETITHNYHLKI